uniref:Uncharacterized protein n=1 Tax=mine drainage metagenome TaxID=410659 RepID=E6PKW4_9ZZZZ
MALEASWRLSLRANPGPAGGYCDVPVRFAQLALRLSGTRALAARPGCRDRGCEWV